MLTSPSGGSTLLLKLTGGFSVNEKEKQMKHQLLLAGLALALAASVEAQPTPKPVKLGIGVFGGTNIPIVQEDQASGSIFGARVRFKLGFITLEPNATFSKLGDPGTVTVGDESLDLGIEGSKVNSFGVDATLGGAPGLPGFKPFFVVGIGSYKIENETTKYDESSVGFNGGLGFGIGLAPKFDLDIRGVAVIVPQGDGGSKKTAAITGGLTFNL